MEYCDKEMNNDKAETSEIREEDEIEVTHEPPNDMINDENDHVSESLQNDEDAIPEEIHDTKVTPLIEESNHSDVNTHDFKELSTIEESVHEDEKNVENEQTSDNETTAMEEDILKQEQSPQVNSDELPDINIEEEIELDREAEAQAKSKPKRSRRKKRTKNPFIAFFLSMYSRRPRQRAADVARQAGRYWGRMSDRQRKIYVAMAGLKIDDKFETTAGS